MDANHVCAGDRRWAEYDARGIFLCYVCDECAKEKLARYRPDVLTDPNYWHDEPLEDDDCRFFYDAPSGAHATDCPSRGNAEWSGSPDPSDPSRYWLCDDCGARIRAED